MDFSSWLSFGWIVKVKRFKKYKRISCVAKTLLHQRKIVSGDLDRILINIKVIWARESECSLEPLLEKFLIWWWVVEDWEAWDSAVGISGKLLHYYLKIKRLTVECVERNQKRNCEELQGHFVAVCYCR